MMHKATIFMTFVFFATCSNGSQSNIVQQEESAASFGPASAQGSLGSLSPRRAEQLARSFSVVSSPVLNNAPRSFDLLEAIQLTKPHKYFILKDCLGSDLHTPVDRTRQIGAIIVEWYRLNEEKVKQRVSQEDLDQKIKQYVLSRAVSARVDALDQLRNLTSASAIEELKGSISKGEL